MELPQSLDPAPVNADPDEDIPHNEVRNWAIRFGVDLWEFGRQFTKANDIRNRFKDSDVDVTRKDGILLLRELAAEVKNFMDFKMNAVMVSSAMRPVRDTFVLLPLYVYRMFSETPSSAHPPAGRVVPAAQVCSGMVLGCCLRSSNLLLGHTDRGGFASTHLKRT
uniref:Uncharacterized protein n=1 Tax=Anopheles minimus TaxID=112268 RepID=A0A182WQ24_9DIPT